MTFMQQQHGPIPSSSTNFSSFRRPSFVQPPHLQIRLATHDRSSWCSEPHNSKHIVGPSVVRARERSLAWCQYVGEVGFPQQRHRSLLPACQGCESATCTERRQHQGRLTPRAEGQWCESCQHEVVAPHTSRSSSSKPLQPIQRRSTTT